MWRVRDVLLVAVFLGGGGYLVYDEWLRPWLEPVPAYVWSLVGWTWVAWAGWHLLQKLSK